MLIVPVILLTFLCCQCDSLAQLVPDSAQLSEWNSFNSKYKEKWDICWNNETGTPGMIFGFKTQAYGTVSDAEAIARQFLKENRKLFKMKADLADLSVLRKLRSKDVDVIDFQETYQGIPVLGCEYSVVVGDDKSVRLAHGKYFPAIWAPTKPNVSSEEAIDAALGSVNIERTNLCDLSSTLVIMPTGPRSFQLAYRIWINQWEIIVNAQSGKVEGKIERIFKTTGIGSIYPKDPVNSSLTNAAIPRLLGAGNTLDGTFVKATNAELGDAWSSAADFRYVPPSYTQHDGTHFDDVNVYHHIDSMAYSYWANIGYPVGFKVRASVHDPYPYGHDNAAAVWPSLQLYFGHGATLFWDFAKKEDVIFHEYTHLISGQIGLTPNYLSPMETRALHEGYSDYHACSFTGDPRAGEWLVRCSSTGDLRTLATYPSEWNYSNRSYLQYAYCSSKQGYLNPPGEPHTWGMIWGGALWDLRKALGASITNFLAYQGLVNVHGSNTTFLNARDGIIAADGQHYGNAHVNTIKHLFSLRGIGPDYYHATVSGPGYLQFKQTGTYTADVSGGSGSYGYQWYSRAEPGGAWQTLGTAQTQSKTMLGADFSMRVDVRDRGTGGNTSGTLYVHYGTADPRIAAGLSNYPNPFNPTTVISYQLSAPGHVTLKVFDVVGREVAALVSENQSAGMHLATFDGSRLASGVYFYMLSAPGITQVKKMLLAK